jgi:hypothetical protein
VTTRPRTRLLTGTLAAALAAIAAAVILPGLLRTSNTSQALPLRQAGELALPGASTRFDYESLDPGRGLLFIAHLGDSQVIETDIRARRVIRVITGLPDVHGVLVVPALHRVYATATGDNQMAATVVLGGEAGNVAYEQDGNHGTGQMCSPTSRLSASSPSLTRPPTASPCPAATTTTA